jgi:hypothetical protein
MNIGSGSVGSLESLDPPCCCSPVKQARGGTGASRGTFERLRGAPGRSEFPHRRRTWPTTQEQAGIRGARHVAGWRLGENRHGRLGRSSGRDRPAARAWAAGGLASGGGMQVVAESGEVGLIFREGDGHAQPKRK